MIAAEAAADMVALLVFVVIALLVARHLTQAADEAMLRSVQALVTPIGLRFAVALALLGQNGLALGAIFLGIIFLTRRCWTALVATVVVVAGGEVLDNLFKAIFERPRPTVLPSLIADQAYSFPSGHAVASAAFFLFVAYLGWQILGAWQRVVWAVVCAALTLTIAFSRLYLDVHYPTDVVAGVALGFFWADSVILGQQLLARQQRRTENGRVRSRR